MESLLRAGKETIEEVYQRHVDMLYRVAYSFMKKWCGRRGYGAGDLCASASQRHDLSLA